MPKRLALCGAIFAALFALWGCAEQAQFYTTKVRPKAYQSIFTLDPASTELVSTLQASQFIKGRSADSTHPKFIDTKPVVATAGKVDFKQVEALEPDLVIALEGTANQADLDKLKADGVELFVWSAAGVPEYKDAIYRMGSLIGQESRASEVVDDVQLALDGSAADPVQPTPVVATVMAQPAGGYTFVGPEHFFSQLIVACKGQAVGGKHGEAVTAASLAALDPDMVLVAGTDAQAAAFISDPQFAGLRAVQATKTSAARGKANVFRVEPGLVRPGSRVQDTLKVIYVALHNLAQAPRGGR